MGVRSISSVVSVIVWRAGAGVCRGIFDVAGPSLPVVSDGLGACLWGLVSGPPEGLVFPLRWGVFTRAAPGLWGVPPGLLSGVALTEAFCPFCPAFSGPEGSAGDPGRGEKLPGRKKRACARKCEGVSSYRL